MLAAPDLCGELTVTHCHGQNPTVHAKHIVIVNVTPQQKQELLLQLKAGFMTH